MLEWVTLEFRGGGLGTIPAMALTSCMVFANPVLPLLSQVFCGLMLLIFFFFLNCTHLPFSLGKYAKPFSLSKVLPLGVAGMT